MVSDLVEIDTLSYIPDAQPVKWICDGGSSYQIVSLIKMKKLFMERSYMLFDMISKKNHV